MPLVEILGHVLGDRLFALTEHAEVTIAHLGRDLVAHVKELSHVQVELRAILVVPQRRSVLGCSPAGDLLRCRKSARVDIDDSRIRGAQRLARRECRRINVLGQRQALAASLGKADQFFEPVGARGLDVDARPELAGAVANGVIDRELVRA